MPSVPDERFGTGSGSGPGDLQEPDLTLARAEEDLRLKTEFALSTWGLGQGGSWAADLDAGTIRFTNDKSWEIEAPVQVIGTLNTKDGTWLWGWDHPSVPEPLAEHARLARALGQEYALEAFTTRKTPGPSPRSPVTSPARRAAIAARRARHWCS